MTSLACPVRRTVVSEPSLDSYACRIASWLTACRVGHQNCREAQVPKESRQMPARLLHVGTSVDRTIKVVDILDPEVTYVALSHCWGAGSKLTLTEDNMQTFKTAIPWDLVPRTFRDAITLTLQLHISYIWIDALCVLQDSLKDWQTESKKMKDIYRHASLVLSADRATDTDAGFLTSRRPGGHIIQIPSYHPDAGHIDQILAVLNHTDESNNDDQYDSTHKWFLSRGEGFSPKNEFVIRNPVFGRAWCMQEQFLATRIVHFLETEMVWECFQDSNCECEGMNEYNRRRCWRTLGFTEVLEPQLWKRTWFELQNMRDSSALLQEWWGCVEQYTCRKLAFKSDILPAISGLAKDFSEDILGRYCAGQWSNDFPFGLLWSPDGMIPPHYRPEHYTAPSWSWASVVGAIERPPSMQNAVAVAKVTQVMTTPVGTDWYGQIEHASLTLTAPMVGVAAFVDRILLEDPPWHLSPSAVGQRDIFEDRVRFCFDQASTSHHELGEYSLSTDLSFAFIAKNAVAHNEMNRIYALLLSPVQAEKGIFQRVGTAKLFTSRGCDFDDLEVCTISIV